MSTPSPAPMPEDKKPTNPVVWLFAAIGVVTSVTGLSSLTQNVFSDVFQWQGWIGTIIENYRSVVSMVFSAFPFRVPEVLADYLVLGTIVVSAAARSMFKVSTEAPQKEQKPREGIVLALDSLRDIAVIKRLLDRITPKTRVGYLLSIPILLVIWPSLVGSLALGMYYPRGAAVRRVATWAWLWLATTFIALAILLGINTQLEPLPYDQRPVFAIAGPLLTVVRN